MTAFRHIYLQLILVQGACLAVGFWIHFQMQRQSLPSVVGQMQHQDVKPVFRQTQANHLRATSVAFLSTWGLLAGLSGLLMLREQRRGVREALERHNESERAALSVFTDDLDDTEQLLEFPTLLAIPGTYSLRLAADNNRADLGDREDVSSERDGAICLTIRT